jgi:hypothetical protein
MEASGQLHAPVALSPGLRARGTNCVGGCVSFRACLNAVAKSKIEELNSGRPAPILISVLIQGNHHGTNGR